MVINAINKIFQDSTLANYECQTDVQKECVKYLVNGIKDGFTQNVLIVGDCGLGKTHLISAVVKALSKFDGQYWKSDTVKMCKIKEIIDNIKRCWSKNADSFDFKVVDAYKTIPLLVIDEVGLQYGSDSERIELYDIFDTRWANKLPIIATSNLLRDAQEGILGARNTDRLWGGAKVFHLEGKSRR